MTRAGVAVGTKVGSTIKVREGKTTSTMQVYRDQPVSDGDIVAIEVISGKDYVSGRLFTAPPPPRPYNDDDDPDPKPKIVTGDSVFAPIETRTYRNGRWVKDTSDLFQGNFSGGNNVGVAFFGEQVRALKGHTIQEARINLTRISGGVAGLQTPTLWLVTQRKRPTGAPSRTDSITGPALAVGDSDPNFVLPDSWIVSMSNGTAGGIAVYDADGSPLMRFAGLGTYTPAFTLSVDWKRLSS